MSVANQCSQRTAFLLDGGPPRSDPKQGIPSCSNQELLKPIPFSSARISLRTSGCDFLPQTWSLYPPALRTSCSQESRAPHDRTGRRSSYPSLDAKFANRTRAGSAVPARPGDPSSDRDRRRSGLLLSLAPASGEAVPDIVPRVEVSAFNNASFPSESIQLSRPQLLILKSGFALGIVVVSAAVLYFRGVPDALLSTDSFVGATFTVLFWTLPALALFLLIPWSVAGIVIEGLALSALFATTWWSSARDTHSTASLGPGIASWIFAPTIIVAGAVVSAGAGRLARRWRKRGDR